MTLRVEGDNHARELVAETARDLHAVARPGAAAAVLDPLVQELHTLEVLVDANTAEGLPTLGEIADTIEGLLVSRHPPCLTDDAAEALYRGAARLQQVERLLVSPA